MADNFTPNQIQSVFGEFKPVFDISQALTGNNVQSVFGELVVVLDEVAGAGAAANPKGPLGLPLTGPFGGPI